MFNEDTQPIDLDKRQLSPIRGLEVAISAPSNVVTVEISDKRPKEGPQLGQVKQGGSPVHAPSSPESWGKPPQRS